MQTTETNNPYFGLRALALSIKPEDIGAGAAAVYGAVVDMPIGGNMATLACFGDSTVSLYFSTGGGMLGLGQAHPAVKEACDAFLEGAGGLFHTLDTADDLALPPEGQHNVFALTRKGIYKARVQVGEPGACSRQARLLFALYQRVLDAIRESGAY